MLTNIHPEIGCRKSDGKDKKQSATFIDLEKAYSRIDRKALWKVLKIVEWEVGY